MKRLILLILLLPVFAYAETWDTDVMAVYDWSNTSNRGYNDTGNSAYDLTWRGTQTFVTYTVKEKVKWTNGGNRGNGFIIPSALRTALAGKSQWQVEGWYQVPAQIPATYAIDEILSINGDWANQYILIGNGYNTGTSKYWLFKAPNEFSFNRGSYPTTGTWEYFIFSWSGTQLKFYLGDGETQTLKSTLNTTTNIFNSASNPWPADNTVMIGDTNQGNVGPLALAGYLDRYIISETDRGGVVTLPLADITETITPTVTPSITATITETITPTSTQTVTVTPTATPSATATITKTDTITLTITRTATATATTTRRPYPSITPTRTVTPRGTPKGIYTYKSPTPTRTPYIRVLGTPRARYATVTPTPTKYWW